MPVLPEIITYGRTLEEAKEMAVDAIKRHLEGLTKDGLPIHRDIITKPVTETVKVSLEVA